MYIHCYLITQQHTGGSVLQRISSAVRCYGRLLLFSCDIVQHNLSCALALIKPFGNATRAKLSPFMYCPCPNTMSNILKQ